MTISTKPEDIDSPETILHYMESYPASGQNRAAAKLIRELLAAVPLVAVSDNEQMPKLPTPFTMVYCEGDLLTDPGEEVPCYSPTQMRSYGKRCFLASQVAPQAIVTDEQITFAMKVAGEYERDGQIHTSCSNAAIMLRNEVLRLRALLATPPVSKATEPEIAFTDASGIKWPVGYSLDPNGKMSCPAGAYEHWLFGYNCGWKEALVARLSAGKADTGEAFDFTAHLARQAAWSEKTFGPGHRVEMVIDHIRKELLEIEAAPQDLEEWVDLIQLALDGAWRSGASPWQIFDGIVAKQTKNEGRTWPDWRTADPTKAIEHDRSKDAAPSTIKVAQAPDKHPSALSIAGIARKHFGSPIPPAAYAFASELIAATLATVKAEPTGEQL